MLRIVEKPWIVVSMFQGILSELDCEQFATEEEALDQLLAFGPPDDDWDYGLLYINKDGLLESCAVAGDFWEKSDA